MKKILSIVLLLAMCLSLFAACGEKTPENTGLEAAKQFIHSSYIGDSANTPVDYKLAGVTRVGDVEYTVEWSANSDKITFERGEDKFVTVHVPNDNLEDINYTLTGKISDAEGNSLTVTFERVVPARTGVPTDVEDGTYVIVWETTTFSSLTSDKNYGYAPFNTVTVTDGTVSGHFKADVLTIKKVGDGFTIQDAYGRYVYLKGTYNSFNVSTEAPEEGHIWQLLTGKDGKTFIVNKMNMKTLAYDSGFSSWGAYPEITEARKSEIVMIKATAPATDPEKPEEPASNADAVLDFANVANRTVFNENQQIWVANGITVTNDKADSTSNVADYSNPARFYKGSSLKIEFAGMKTIKIYCNSGKPVSGLTDSLTGIEGITVSVDGNVVTITFDTAVDSFVIATLAAQFRVDKIEIFK